MTSLLSQQSESGELVPRWHRVPRVVATRARARTVREEAESAGARVLDFSQTWLLTLPAADELVCNGSWDATTGESSEVRVKVVAALTRRGMLP